MIVILSFLKINNSIQKLDFVAPDGTTMYYGLRAGGKFNVKKHYFFPSLIAVTFLLFLVAAFKINSFNAIFFILRPYCQFKDLRTVTNNF